MQIIDEIFIPGTDKRYKLIIEKLDNDRINYEIYSVKKKIILKDSTAWGNKNKSPMMRTYGISFIDEREDTVQRRIYMKDILKICKISLN